MNKAAVGIAIGSIALLGLTGVAASMSQTDVSTPTTSASASPRSTRVTTSPTPVATRVATPNYVEPTAIPTTPAPLARTDASAPVVAPVARCEEDQPCWDCKTMGNRICGPAPVTPAHVAPVAPVVPAPVPTVVPTTNVVIPTPAPTPTIDCAHLKPGDGFAGISQVCHLDPNDPLYTGPKPTQSATPAPCVTHTPDVTCDAIGCPTLNK